jgi:DNA-binding response OmpR family regulator
VNLPIKLNALFGDIQALLKNNVSADILEMGPNWSLSLQHKTLVNEQSGKTLDLTDKEIQILQIIYTNGGVSREILLKEVWGIDLALDTHTLETHIYRLRKKIRDAFGCEIINAIENGYILDDSVI